MKPDQTMSNSFPTTAVASFSIEIGGYSSNSGHVVAGCIGFQRVAVVATRLVRRL